MPSDSQGFRLAKVLAFSSSLGRPILRFASGLAIGCFIPSFPSVYSPKFDATCQKPTKASNQIESSLAPLCEAVPVLPLARRFGPSLAPECSLAFVAPFALALGCPFAGSVYKYSCAISAQFLRYFCAICKPIRRNNPSNNLPSS